jgi:hypothetical protein
MMGRVAGMLLCSGIVVVVAVPPSGPPPHHSAAAIYEPSTPTYDKKRPDAPPTPRSNAEFGVASTAHHVRKKQLPAAGAAGSGVCIDDPEGIVAAEAGAMGFPNNCPGALAKVGGDCDLDLSTMGLPGMLSRDLCPLSCGDCEHNHGSTDDLPTEDCSMEIGVDYFGNDLVGWTPTKTGTPAACCALCLQRSECHAWGWNDGSTPAAQPYKHLCFLKTTVGSTRVINSAVTSGGRNTP